MNTYQTLTFRDWLAHLPRSTKIYLARQIELIAKKMTKTQESYRTSTGMLNVEHLGLQWKIHYETILDDIIVMGHGDDLSANSQGRRDLIPFDMAYFLNTEADISLYLQILLENGNSTEISESLDHIAHACGLSTFDGHAGSIRKNFSKNGDLDALLRVARKLEFHGEMSSRNMTQLHKTEQQF